MEFIGAGINHLFGKSGAQIMDAKAFNMPLQMLVDMSNILLIDNEEKFDVFISMLQNLYEVRMEAFSKCQTQEAVNAFYSGLIRNSDNMDMLAIAIATHAMQFLDDYSETGVDYNKFMHMCELVHNISKIGF